MEKGLVSIITPCYNTAKYVHRLLDSILAQTYPSIEIFIIDDGSKDNLQKLVDEYMPVFEKKGYNFEYVYQENQGQSVAINRGLKLINGEYLVWPDSDDYYITSNAIEVMVEKLLTSSSDVGMVRTLANLVDETTHQVKYKLGTLYLKNPKTNLFEDCLFARPSFWFPPGEYMVKVDSLKKCIPNLEIYTSKNAGQNWQLMLPILYNCKCTTIPEYHYNILIRKLSHSRGQYKTCEDQLKKIEAYENTILSTLSIIDMPVNLKDSYFQSISIKYLKCRLEIYKKFNIKQDANLIYRNLINTYGVNVFSTKERISLFLYFSFGVRSLLSFWK